MLFYNDVIFAAFKFGFNSEAISEFTQYQYLLKEEIKCRKKLDGLRKIAIGHKAKNAQLQRRGSVKPVTANPIEKMLFMGMMMKAWKNYAKITSAKMQAAQENGVDYVYSESEEEDSQQIESEYEDSDYDLDDENPGSQEGRYFDHHNNDNNLIEEEEEEDQEEVLSQTEKGKSGLMDEERRISSNLQGEMADGLKSLQTRTRRSLSPFIEKKELSRVTAERKRSFSILPAPQIFMHSAEGEIHDITPKVSGLGEKSFASHANPGSKSFNDC